MMCNGGALFLNQSKHRCSVAVSCQPYFVIKNLFLGYSAGPESAHKGSNREIQSLSVPRESQLTLKVVATDILPPNFASEGNIARRGVTPLPLRFKGSWLLGRFAAVLTPTGQDWLLPELGHWASATGALNWEAH